MTTTKTDKWANARGAAARKAAAQHRVMTPTGNCYHFTMNGIRTMCGADVDVERTEALGRGEFREVYYCATCTKAAR